METQIISYLITGGDSTGNGTEDTYSSGMSNSSSKYSGITLELVIKVTTWVAGIKALITAIDENASVNIRDANGVIIHQETGVK